METMFQYFMICDKNNIIIETSDPGEEIRKIINNIINSAATPSGLYDKNGIRFAYIIYEDFFFILACANTVPVRSIMYFLDHVSEDFKDKYIFRRLKLRRKRYRQWLIQELDILSPDSDKLKGVIAEVDEIKSIMLENCKKTYQRQEGLEKLIIGTNDLERNAEELHSNAKKLKCSKCRKYYFCCFASCCPCFN